MKHNPTHFKWRHFEPSRIILCVRWYCRYELSYCALEEMMRERGLAKAMLDCIEDEAPLPQMAGIKRRNLSCLWATPIGSW